MLTPSSWGQALGAEAAAALLAVCFKQIKIHRVWAGCTAENTASWRLMERIGMRREGHSVRSGLHRDGTWRDGYIYALLADEWAQPDQASTQF